MEQMMFRYPVASLVGDYVRSGVGLALTGLPATQLPVEGIAFWLLSGLALLFVGLAGYTFLRHATRIVMNDETIESLPGGAVIEWKDVREIKLSYFSTRTDRKNGWMQLTINSGKLKLRMDSRIDGFLTIASGVLDQTRCSDVSLSDATSTNFESLGLNP